jgi:hypothetical protein
MVNSKRDSISLAQWDDLGSRLHSGALFRQYELTTSEIHLRP